MDFTLTRVKPRRSPTWFGWGLIATLFLGIFLGLFLNLYAFLAPEREPNEGVMVVEGWIHDFALDEAVRMYRAGNYSRIVCTGVPIDTGSYLIQFKSYSEMTAMRLKKMGLPEKEIITAIGYDTKKDRTYASAVALREAIIAYHLEETDIHLISIGPHGRRSRMLFRKALGNDYNVGVTCLDPSNYDATNWMICSEGVRSVISECIAFTYAKLFFYP